MHLPVCLLALIGCAAAQIALPNPEAAAVEASTRSLASASNATMVAEASGHHYDKYRHNKHDSYGYGGYGGYSGYGGHAGYGYSQDYGYSHSPAYGYGHGYHTQSCYGQAPGRYGNADYNCQSFSVCQSDGRLDIMDCPAYTRFNNHLQVCDWPYKVDSYCNPIYKDEYSYQPSYGYGYEKNYGHKGYEHSYKSYEKPSYTNSYGYSSKSHDSYGYSPKSYDSYGYSPKSYESYGYSPKSHAYGYSHDSYPKSSYGYAPSYSNYYKKY